MRAQSWYNDEPPYSLSGYLNDKTSRMYSDLIMRQIRVKKGTHNVVIYFEF